MVLIKDNEVYVKILYWGMYQSGKTTILDSLFRLTKEQQKDIVPVGNLTKIGAASGSTLYFDRGLFQSKKQNQVFYMVYTTAGQRSYSTLRERVFEGSDGIIFVVDSKMHLIEENIEFLKELKTIAGDSLIQKIPLVIMLNKQDLDDVIGIEDIKKVLKEEKLWFNSGNYLSLWNPGIFETCALYESQKNIYEAFQECSRRTVLYQIYGDGEAPKEKPDVIKEEKIS